MKIHKKHWGAVLLAIVIGVLCIAPPIAFRYSSSYRGIDMMGADAESHYLARIQEVYDGFPSQGDVFLPNKNIPPMEPGLGEWLMARAGQLLHLSASSAEMYGKFVLPFFIALLIYVFAYALSASRAAGALSVLLVMLGDSFVSYPKKLLGLFHGTAPTSGFLTYARPVDPEISALLLFGALYLIFELFFAHPSAARTQRRVAALIGTGLLTGMSLYVSFYTFAFLLTLGALFAVYKFARRQYASVIDLLIVGALALACAIPFLVNYRQLIANTVYTSASMRFGLISTHAPLFSVLLSALLIIALVLPRGLAPARLFFALSGIALLLLINQQILTGHELQSGHFHWYVTKPLVSIACVMLFIELSRRAAPRYGVRLALYVGVGAVLLYAGILIQIVSYRAVLPETVAAQAYKPVLAWLSVQPVRNTVWADTVLSPYISIYTRDNSPDNPYAGYYLIPQSYLVESTLLTYRLEGIAPRNIQAQLDRDRAQISQRISGVYWDEKAGSYAALPESYLANYANLYSSLYQAPLSSVFADLGVNEVVWDTKTDPNWSLDTQLAGYSKITVGRYRIYKLPSS